MQKNIVSLKKNDFEEDDSLTLDEFLQNMESLNQKLESLPATIFSADDLDFADETDDLADYQPKPLLGKKTIEHLETVLEAYQKKPIASYLKRLFSGTLGEIEEKSESKDDLVESAEKLTDKELRLLQVEREIEDYMERMDAVLKGSTDCDERLLEYLCIRVKCVARLLIEKDFLSQSNADYDEDQVNQYVNAQLSEKMLALLNELLEPIKETLIANIDKENQQALKTSKGKSLKKLDPHKWKGFCKRLLARTAD